MLMEAREKMLAAGLRGSGEALAVETLFGLLSDFQIEHGDHRSAEPAARAAQGARRPAARQARTAAASPAIRQASTRRSTPSSRGYSLTRRRSRARSSLWSGPTPRATDLSTSWRASIPARPDLDALYDAFLTQTFTARKTLLKKATAVLIPDVAHRAHAMRRCDSNLRTMIACAPNWSSAATRCSTSSRRSADALRAQQTRPLAARFRRSRRKARCAARRREPGHMGALQARRADQPRPGRRGTGHQPAAMGRDPFADRGVLLRRQRRRPAAHTVRRRRPEAVDLLVPGRRPGGVRRPRAGRCCSRRAAVNFAVDAGETALQLPHAAQRARRRGPRVRADRACARACWSPTSCTTPRVPRAAAW